MSNEPILPEKVLLEAGEIYGSPRAGITKGMFYAAVDSGLLKGVLPGGRKARRKYRRTEVVRVFRLEG